MTMTATEALALAEAAITRIELDMFDSGDLERLERLRAERAELVRIRDFAEQRVAAERVTEERPRPPKWQLWAEWQEVRFLSRSRLSPRLKARLIDKFGIVNYGRLPW